MEHPHQRLDPAPTDEPPRPPPAVHPPVDDRPWRARWLFLALITVAVAAADQATKHWAQTDLQYRPGRRVPVVDGYLALSYVRNPGAAWGFLSRAKGSFRRPFFIGVSLVAMAFILYLCLRLQRGQLLLLGALSLVMGGAVGNFIDRVRFNYVVDFVDFHIGKGLKWPTFNVADVAISIGVGLLFLEMFVLPWSRRRRIRATIARADVEARRRGAVPEAEDSRQERELP